MLPNSTSLLHSTVVVLDSIHEAQCPRYVPYRLGLTYGQGVCYICENDRAPGSRGNCFWGQPKGLKQSSPTMESALAASSEGQRRSYLGGA